MGVGNRPAACASCGKRLTYKSWYYRNGKHYCKRRCWETDVAKAAEERAKAQEKQAQEQAKANAAAAAPAPAPAAPNPSATTTQETPEPPAA